MKFLTTKILAPIVFNIDYSRVETSKTQLVGGESKRSERNVSYMSTTQPQQTSVVGVHPSLRHSMGPTSSRLNSASMATQNAAKFSHSKSKSVATEQNFQPNPSQSAPQNFAESFTTRALTSMLQATPPERHTRPLSLFITEPKTKSRYGSKKYQSSSSSVALIV